AAELRAGRASRARPFAVFTLDDGYRDNLEHALPVFRRHGCPFTVFVATAYAEGRGELWWEILEQAIATQEVIRPEIEGLPAEIVTDTDEDRTAAWNLLYPVVRWRMEEHAQRDWTRRFAERHGIDTDALCRAMVMDWAALAELTAGGLCTIGAHTVHHYALARLTDEEEVLREMTESRERIAAELGGAVETFAYPYGDAGSAATREFRLAAAAGFSCAVTTRKGLVPAAPDSLTALPRVSLNGLYQKLRYVDVMLTGAPFALAGRLAG
ncbi:MAG TPA: polysaccharide deacetylase, partial [Bryobacterales bacterium]|nr:polysaccharide deacetylase [Bryobacterales bacterium]